MSIIETLKTKRLNLNEIINFIILLIGILIAINIYQRQNKKIAQIYQIQSKEREKIKILLKIEDLREKINLYKEVFKPVDSREVINVVTKLAAAANVKIVSLKSREKLATDSKKHEGLNTIFIDLVAEINSYHQLGEFINRIETNSMILFVEKIQMKVSTKERMVSQSETIKVNLIIGKSSLS